MFERAITVVITLLAAAAAALHGTHALAADTPPCSVEKVPGQFGPFDYRTAAAADKNIVEGAHFTKDVETLRKGSSSVNIADDIGYTLHAFPNHPRALLAMSNLGLKLKTQRPPGARFTVDCYFERAVHFRPDDQMVRLVLGIHLTRRGQKEAARTQLEIAERYPLNDANFHYNLGLAFLDADDADRALVHAWKAYELGYELPGLRNRLERAGKWRDPDK